MKDICIKCGKEYDIKEWLRCPHCARKEYKKRKENNAFRELRWYTDRPLVYCKFYRVIEAILNSCPQ